MSRLIDLLKLKNLEISYNIKSEDLINNPNITIEELRENAYSIKLNIKIIIIYLEARM